jgi:hypothetical protein
VQLEGTRSTLASRLRGPWSWIVRVAARVPRPLLLALPFCLIPLVWTSPRLLIETADYNNPLDAGRWIAHIFAGWNPDNLGAPTYRDAPLLFPYLAFWRLGEALSLPVEAVQRLWLCGLFAVAFVSAWSLLRLIAPEASDAGWPATVVILAYVFNPFTLTYWAIGHQIAFLAYAIAPLWLSTLIRTVRKRPSWTTGIPLALVSLLFASSFNNPAIVATMIVVPSILACGFLLAAREVNIRRLLASFFSVVPWFMLLNAWWLLPFARAAFARASYSYPGSAANLLGWPNLADRVDFWEFVRGTGYWGFHTGYRGVPYFAWASYLRDPIVVGATLWLAACVFLPLLLRRRSLVWTSLPIVLFAIGVFFAKATNPPLGGVNRWLYLNVPGFFLFRSAYEKFAGLSFLALLIALAWMLRSFRPSVRVRDLLYGITGCAVALSALPLLVGTVIQERTSSGVTPAISVPPYYERLAQWSREQGEGSLLFVPQAPTGYVKTTWGFAGADFIQNFSSMPVVTGAPDAVAGDSPTIASFLRAAREFDSPLLLRRYGITHVVVRRDIDVAYYPGTLQPATVEARLRVAGFPFVKTIGRFRVFEVPVPVSRVWGASVALAPAGSAAAQRWLLSETTSPVVRGAQGPAVRRGCVPDPRDLVGTPGTLQQLCGIEDSPYDIRVLSQRVAVEVRRRGGHAVVGFSSLTGTQVDLVSDVMNASQEIEMPLRHRTRAVRIEGLVLPLDDGRQASGEVTLRPGSQIQLLREGQALVTDGSFESEARADEVGGSALVASRDATDGRYSLDVVARGESAHVFRSVQPFDPASTLEVNFDYRHVKGDRPAFGLWQGGIERYAIRDFRLRRRPGWHHYRALVAPDPNANSLDVFLYSFARGDGVTINRYDDLVVRELPVAESATVTTWDAIHDPSSWEVQVPSLEGPSLIADGSFETTLWNGANTLGGDGSALVDAIASPDAVEGDVSLELRAVDGGVFTSQGISPFDGDALYKISFAYRHIEGNPPAFGVWDSATGDYLAKDFALSTEPGWHRSETVVSPGPEAAALSILLYSFAGDGGRAVNRYDDVRVTTIEVPQRLLVVEGRSSPPDPTTEVQQQSDGEYAGVVRGIEGEAWLVLPQTFDDRWHLQVQAADGSMARVLRHVRVDGYANGWLIQGRGEVRFTIGYGGSSDGARGLALTMLGLGLLVLLAGHRLQRQRLADARTDAPEVIG